jgi:hypothetical protein
LDIYIEILLGAHPILHISRIRVKEKIKIDAIITKKKFKNKLFIQK